jgi:hypothetical protein
MALLDLDGTEQPIDPKLVLAIEAAFRSVSLTQVQFVAAPRSWYHPNGSISGPKGDRKAQIKMELAKRDGAQCAYCDREFVDLVDATLDHVIPNTIVRHWQPWNLLLACEACNNAKADRLPLVLMPMLCTLLRALSDVAVAQQTRRTNSRSAHKRRQRARKRHARHAAAVNEAIEAMTGMPVRLALEAAPAGGQA